MFSLQRKIAIGDKDIIKYLLVNDKTDIDWFSIFILIVESFIIISVFIVDPQMRFILVKNRP